MKNKFLGNSVPLVIGILIAVNTLVSYIGFINLSFFNRYKFDIAHLGSKNYYRYLSSAFLHVSWMHLFFNMYTLYLFGYAVVQSLGVERFLVVYFGSLIAGNLFAAVYHRKAAHYAAVGASGAVTGIVFSTILLYPALELYLFFIPLPIPGFAFAAGYVAYSLYGMKKQNDSIGHTAHLGGALSGVVVSLAFEPGLFIEAKQTLLYLMITTLGVGFWLFRQR